MTHLARLSKFMKLTVFLLVMTVGSVFVGQAASAAPDKSTDDPYEALRALTGPAKGSSDSVNMVLSGELATRCAPVDVLYYCIGLGWYDQLPSVGPLAEVAASMGLGDAAADTLKQTAKSAAGDEEIRHEIDAAIAAADKVIYHHYLGKVPADVRTRFPGIDKLKSISVPTLAPNPRQGGGASLKWGDDNKGLKQPNDWTCGPTSMAIIAWNDPAVGNTAGYNDPMHWVPIVEATADQGAAIGNIVSGINKYTPTWVNRVDKYAVVSVANWDINKWQWVFEHHIGKQAPILLHPWLSTMQYWPASAKAGGHFNVGRGYFVQVDVGITTAYIYEPAGAQLGLGTTVSASIANIREAHVAHPQKNIGH